MPIRTLPHKYALANRDLFYWQHGVLRLWLPFFEESGTVAADVSKYGNHGTINGASWVDGKYGKGLSFDGDDYVDFATSGFPSGSEAFTFTGWVKRAGAVVDGYVFCYGTADTGKMCGLMMFADGHLYFAGYARDAISDLVVPNDNKFHFISVGIPKDSTSVTFTLDSVTNIKTISAVLNVVLTTGKLGARIDGVQCLVFELDEPRFYNKFLTNDELLAFYKVGYGV